MYVALVGIPVQLIELSDRPCHSKHVVDVPQSVGLVEYRYPPHAAHMMCVLAPRIHATSRA